MIVAFKVSKKKVSCNLSAMKEGIGKADTTMLNY